MSNSVIAVYLQHHPDAPLSEASFRVGQMICVAINADPVWFWRGVPTFDRRVAPGRKEQTRKS